MNPVDFVNLCRGKTELEIYRLLQQELGPTAGDSAELSRRALLVTALREAKLYPERKPAEAA